MRRWDYVRSLAAPTTHRHDYISEYVNDLDSVVDLEAVRDARLSLCADPLGGAGVAYWGRIAERYRLSMTLEHDTVDPTFRFMTVDWDGKIRMDCSSPYAMAGLIALKDRFDLAFACDTDHDRHGIVTRTAGLLPPNHYLSAAIWYLFGNRPGWRAESAVGKTLVSSAMIDRVASHLGRRLVEVPVGFKWFVDGLLDGGLGFGGEESAGASFLRRDGSVWTTDKDGLIMGLLAAEMLARTGQDPAALYASLAARFGDPVYERIDAPATPAEKQILGRLSPEQVHRSRTGRRPHRGHAHQGARQRCAHWRPEGDHPPRLVRRTPLRHRGRLQDLRRELRRPGALTPDPARSPEVGG